MSSIEDRIKTFTEDLHNRKVGCPAAHSAVQHGARIIATGATGQEKNMQATVENTLREFWGDQMAKIFALFPKEEPASFSESSQAFREIYFALSIASYRLYREVLQQQFFANPPAEQLSVLEELQGITFKEDELHYLFHEHGAQIWEYISVCRPLVYDLIAPKPIGKLERMWDEMIVLTVRPEYPPYPAHRRHSRVSAMIVTKGSDIDKLIDDVRLQDTYAETTAWSADSPDNYRLGVHVPYPSPDPNYVMQKQTGYMNLRAQLSEDGIVRKVSISDSEKMIALAGEIGLNRDTLLQCLQLLQPGELLPIFLHCLQQGISGSEAVLRIVTETVSD